MERGSNMLCSWWRDYVQEEPPDQMQCIGSKYFDGRFRLFFLHSSLQGSFRKRPSSAMGGVDSWRQTPRLRGQQLSGHRVPPKWQQTPSESLQGPTSVRYPQRMSAYFFGDHIFVRLVHLLHSGTLCNSPRKSPATTPRMRSLLATITFSCCSVECGV